MNDLHLDSSYDLEVVENDLVLTDGQEAIRQHVTQRLKTFLGEWFLDDRIGVPYFQEILKKGPNPTIVDSSLKNQIAGTPGVIDIKEFDLDLDNSSRELSLNFRARTIDGTINFSEIL